MHDSDDSALQRANLLRMAAAIAVAYAGNNTLPADHVPDVIRLVYNSLSTVIGESGSTYAEGRQPAVLIRKSITPDYIVCLEDGKKFKMLKRHLRTSYGLTPAAYRTKWGLPTDYPMVASNYATKRSSLAKKIGLGRKLGRKRKSR
jgi:predicted transcriptional regulator